MINLPNENINFLRNPSPLNIFPKRAINDTRGRGSRVQSHPVLANFMISRFYRIFPYFEGGQHRESFPFVLLIGVAIIFLAIPGSKH